MTNPTRILRISPFCGMESANFDRRTLVISKDYEVFQEKIGKLDRIQVRFRKMDFSVLKSDKNFGIPVPST